MPVLVSLPSLEVFRAVLGKHKLVRFQNVSARHVVLDHVWLHLGYARPHNTILIQSF